MGRDDSVVRPRCPVTVVPRLDARTRADADLDPLLARLRPDRVHVHNVVNPAVLAWAAGVDAVVTIQDHRSGSGLPLVVAGTGPLRREIDAEGVEVLGWLDRRRLSAAYRRAAVLVMPSRWQEPFGIGGLEALTLGTPVAAWDSGGVREWHPGGELLVP